MSYDATSAHYLMGKLTITRSRVLEALGILGPNDIPECGFIADLLWDGRNDVAPEDLPEGDIELATPGFTGEGSGYSWESGLYLKALGLTRGRADILIVWGGGESFSGMRVRDGSVTVREVVISLGEEP